VRELQPNTVLFSDAGPDIRWVGNERGNRSETCLGDLETATISNRATPTRRA